MRNQAAELTFECIAIGRLLVILVCKGRLHFLHPRYTILVLQNRCNLYTQSTENIVAQQQQAAHGDRPMAVTV